MQKIKRLLLVLACACFVFYAASCGSTDDKTGGSGEQNTQTTIEEGKNETDGTETNKSDGTETQKDAEEKNDTVGDQEPSSTENNDDKGENTDETQTEGGASSDIDSKTDSETDTETDVKTDTETGGETGDGFESESDPVIHNHELSHFEATAATCTESGNIEYWYCSSCGMYFSDKECENEIEYSKVIISATGHDYKKIVTSPTCTEEGYTTHTCVNCRDSTDKRVEATGHTEGEAVVENVVAATCTGNGSYDSVVYCTECGEELSRETVTVPATGHNYEETVTAPTKTEKGYTTCTCSACGDCYVADYTSAIGSVGLSYTLSDDESYYIVSGIGECTDTEIVIPETHGNLPVSEIYKSAFSGNGSITSVVIGDNVTTIGTGVFLGCSSLTSVIIGKSVTSVGKNLFYKCTELTEVIFNAEAMDDLSSENGIFRRAGQSGSGITVTIGANVTKIPAYLFYPTTSTSDLPKITTVYFEANSVCASIGSFAFGYCSELTSITIPENVKTIGNKAFYNCSSLTEVVFNATNMDDLSSGGSLSGNFVFYCAGQSGNGITVTIGANVTKIPANLFYPTTSTPGTYRPYITGVEFEKGSVCESIGENAFCYCSALESITFPASVITIGEGAFRYCSALTSVAFEEDSKCTSIGNYAFESCSTLTSITIPASVTAIGSKAFNSCSLLTSVTFEVTEGWYYATEGATSGTTLDLTDSTTAAKYLVSNYTERYWYRKQS